MYTEIGGWWLIGFVNAVAASIHQYDHPMFGFVDKTHFVKLMEPVHPGYESTPFLWSCSTEGQQALVGRESGSRHSSEPLEEAKPRISIRIQHLTRSSP